MARFVWFRVVLCFLEEVERDKTWGKPSHPAENVLRTPSKDLSWGSDIP